MFMFKENPLHSDSDVMVALDSRHFDQLAKSFLHKEKQKLWKIIEQAVMIMNDGVI